MFSRGEKKMTHRTKNTSHPDKTISATLIRASSITKKIEEALWGMRCGVKASKLKVVAA